MNLDINEGSFMFGFVLGGLVCAVIFCTAIFIVTTPPAPKKVSHDYPAFLDQH